MFLQLEFFLLVRFCRKYSFTTYIASCFVSLYLESLIVLSSQVERLYKIYSFIPRHSLSPVLEECVCVCVWGGGVGGGEGIHGYNMILYVRPRDGKEGSIDIQLLVVFIISRYQSCQSPAVSKATAPTSCS